MIEESELKHVIEILRKYDEILMIEKEPSKIIVHTSNKYVDYRKFRSLKKELESIGYLVRARKFSMLADSYSYEIFKYFKMQKDSNLIPIILFIATCFSLFLSGYFFLFNNGLNSAIYTLAVLLILGLHELGHYVVAKMQDLRVSLPFFIPGFPYGTFGAIIRLKEPFVDRFQAFDVGISGPLLGLLPSVIFLLIGIQFSEAKVIPQQSREYFPLPLLAYLLFSISFPQGSTIFLHPLTFAALLGLLITFLNMTPIAQLDGGHVMNSVVGNRLLLKRLLVFAGLFVLIITQFIAMAILALFLLFFESEPLNSTTNVDRKRNIYGLLFLACWLLLLPLPFSSYYLTPFK